MKKKNWFLVTTLIVGGSDSSSPSCVIPCKTYAEVEKAKKLLKKMGYKKSVLWLREGCLA